MKCPHCTKEIHFEEYQSWTFQYDNPASEKVTGYEVVYTFCPSCENLIVMMRDGIYHEEKGARDWVTDTCNEELLFPKGIVRPVEQEVPEKYIDDFKEAASVLSISPKASAAISRRLLQHLLRDECKVKKSSLAKEIDEFTAIPAQNKHNLLEIKRMISKGLRKPLSKRDNFLILLIKVMMQLFLLNQRVKISFVNFLKQIVMISKGYISFEREFLMSL